MPARNVVEQVIGINLAECYLNKWNPSVGFQSVEKHASTLAERYDGTGKVIGETSVAAMAETIGLGPVAGAQKALTVGWSTEKMASAIERIVGLPENSATEKVEAARYYLEQTAQDRATVIEELEVVRTSGLEQMFVFDPKFVENYRAMWAAVNAISGLIANREINIADRDDDRADKELAAYADRRRARVHLQRLVRIDCGPACVLLRVLS